MPPLIALILAAAPAPSAPPPCAANQLSLGFDTEGGAFDGMSHGGALLVIRNLGPTACSVPGLPRLTFADARGKALPFVRNVPRGMHPGPVVRPVGIAAGAEVTAPLRWVSGEVFDKSLCLTSATAAITIGGGTIRTPFVARLCGPAGGSMTFDQPLLRADPVL